MFSSAMADRWHRAASIQASRKPPKANDSCWPATAMVRRCRLLTMDAAASRFGSQLSIKLRPTAVGQERPPAADQTGHSFQPV
jgi:hypothetical protein